jgi:mannose-1-phosphate guanylyltransferase
LRYVVDPEPLGTAGAIRNAEDLLDGAPFLVLNGDILTDLDLDAFAERHRASGAVGTVALTPVDDPSAFGLVRLRDDGAVEEFLEKPRPEDLRPGEPFRINAGTYLLHPDVLARIPAGRACSIEREVFPALAADGLLHGFPSDAYWRDIGTHASYLAANHDVLTGALRTESPAGAAYLGEGASVDPSARVDARSCVGAGAVVGAGATVAGSVVGANARIGDGAVLEDAVVGDSVDVGAGARLGPGVVVGDGARIGAGQTVDPDTPVPTAATIAA